MTRQVDAALAGLHPSNQTREQSLVDEVRRLREQVAEHDARWGQLRAKLGDISDDAEAMHSRTLEQYYSGVIQACDDVRDWLDGVVLAVRKDGSAAVPTYAEMANAAFGQITSGALDACAVFGNCAHGPDSEPPFMVLTLTPALEAQLAILAQADAERAIAAIDAARDAARVGLAKAISANDADFRGGVL